MCDKSGHVCPECRGMRFLRQDRDVNDEYFGRVTRCGCCEGNQVSQRKESERIRIYKAQRKAALMPTQTQTQIEEQP